VEVVFKCRTSDKVFEKQQKGNLELQMHFEHTVKLPISRLQRDLTNIYVSGSLLYSIIAFDYFKS
jgi:hypothetical protein